MNISDVVIVGGKRTPMAEYAGTPGHGLFADLTAPQLGALAIREAVLDARVEPSSIDNVVLGNVVQSGKDAIYCARHAALRAELPVETPAVTINRLCGSGAQAIIDAARTILLGESETAVAGGTENMSQVPHVVRGLRGGAVRFGASPVLEDYLFDSLRDSLPGVFMAETAQNLAKKYNISREEQDAFALRSQQEAARALEAGFFKEEIFPVTIKTRKGEVVVEHDTHMRPDTTAESLARLRPAFGKDGTVTAGNASGIVDGAAAVVLTTRDRAERDGLTVKAQLLGWGVAGVPPEIMGFGPVPAIQKALSHAGLALDQMDLIEVNEAFAAQYLAVEKELGLPRERVNINGGAIALGHPLAVSGTRLAITLANALRARGGGQGVASACIGGGQGIAVCLRVS